MPANVLGVDTDVLAFVTASVSANIEREPLPAEGRMDATLRLHKAGMPRQTIADLLHVSKSTVDRDITLAGDAEMMEHVRELRTITMSNAAQLLATADKAKRRDEFKAFLTEWGRQAQAEINAEVAARASRDKPPLAEAQTYPRSRMTAEMVKHWRQALEKKLPLTVPGLQVHGVAQHGERPGPRRNRRGVEAGCRPDCGGRRQDRPPVPGPGSRVGAGLGRQGRGRERRVGRRTLPVR